MFTTQSFAKGQLVCEYTGEVISSADAKQRETLYALDDTCGNFLLYYKYNRRQMCVDATEDNGRIGRIINHSRKRNNLDLKLVEVDGNAHVCLFANRLIKSGEEVLYDYGERNKDAVEAHPWLST